MKSRVDDLEYLDGKVEGLTSITYGMLVYAVEKVGEGPLTAALRAQLEALHTTKAALDATPIFEPGS